MFAGFIRGLRRILSTERSFVGVPGSPWPEDWQTEERFRYITIPREQKWLLLDMQTGQMGGWFDDVRKAVDKAQYLQALDPESCWIVLMIQGVVKDGDPTADPIPKALSKFAKVEPRPEGWRTEERLRYVTIPTKPEWLLLDVRTGQMGGWFDDVRKAIDTAQYLQALDPESCWIVLITSALVGPGNPTSDPIPNALSKFAEVEPPPGWSVSDHARSHPNWRNP